MSSCCQTLCVRAGDTESSGALTAVAAVAQEVGTNRKIGGSISGSFSPHVDVSLGKKIAPDCCANGVWMLSFHLEEQVGTLCGRPCHHQCMNVCERVNVTAFIVTSSRFMTLCKSFCGTCVVAEIAALLSEALWSIASLEFLVKYSTVVVFYCHRKGIHLWVICINTVLWISIRSAVSYHTYK